MPAVQIVVFFFQAEDGIRDIGVTWSSDVCSSDLTTLAGEGLQHQDGHSLVLSSTVPTCAAYDPAYAYEIAVIVQDGIRRMYQEQEDRFYYLRSEERRVGKECRSRWSPDN